MSKVAYVKELPKCDLCIQHQVKPPNTAKYDARTTFGPWANLCPGCFAVYGPGKLGTGFGQELVVGEKPEVKTHWLADELGLTQEEFEMECEDYGIDPSEV